MSKLDPRQYDESQHERTKSKSIEDNPEESGDRVKVFLNSNKFVPPPQFTTTTLFSLR